MHWSAELYRVMEVPLGTTITEPLALAGASFEEQARARAWFDQLREGLEPAPVVLSSRRANGSLRVLEVRGRIDTNPHGHATLYGLAIDVSRTAALEDELRRAAKLEAVGTLAAGVAHDFNNYLTVLSIHLDLLDAQVEPSLGAPIARMRRAVDQSASLTAQLLTFARRAPSEAERLELSDQIKAFVELFGHIVGPEIAFHCEVADAPMTVRLDPGQLESALANLVTNARDATSAGGWIRVSLGEVTLAAGDPRLDGLAPGRFARISVADSGHGIPAADLSRIFEPYFTTKDQRGGTGLGLASVYGFVRQAGGRIDVVSTVGVGTTFHLYFRLVQAPDSRPPRPVEELRVARRARVLVVEDVDDVREVTRDLLLAERCEVFVARDGWEALAVVARERPAVVLTDLRMPRMDGHTLIDRLRREFPEIRLVAMTGYAEAAPVPGVPVLHKPFDRRSLRLALALEEAS
jgi:signal transduction histidine kinase/CheY-like chemotaxis protein